MPEQITVIVGMSESEGRASSTGTLHAKGGRLTEIELDTQRIADEMSKLLRCVEGVETPQESRFDISEIQFNLGISAKGKLAIFSCGAEAGLEAAIKVTIKRRVADGD
ncbi:MAG: hypothetical protein JXQ75_04510 [Phycisphaerae bacterium]|nr:hypothetical protein [Phycisphaerae bacterium]